MGFGAPAGKINQTQSFSATTAQKDDENGVIEEFTAYGATSETTEEVYIDAASFDNEATNEQSGTSIVTAHSLIESNTEYARANKTTIAALPATTTTT